MDGLLGGGILGLIRNTYFPFLPTVTLNAFVEADFDIGEEAGGTVLRQKYAFGRRLLFHEIYVLLSGAESFFLHMLRQGYYNSLWDGWDTPHLFNRKTRSKNTVEKTTKRTPPKKPKHRRRLPAGTLHDRDNMLSLFGVVADPGVPSTRGHLPRDRETRDRDRGPRDLLGGSVTQRLVGCRAGSCGQEFWDSERRGSGWCLPLPSGTSDA